MGSSALGGGFTAVDWAVVGGFLVLTTLIGGPLAGRQATFRDFFLGGRRLPWPAVAASLVATEISAVTFISLPMVVFRPGGNWTYLQLSLIGMLVARLIVAWILVPAYFEREIYSPYDYMGRRLGAGVRGVTTAIFALGGVLAQGVRVYLTALVLEVLLVDELAWVEAATGLPPLWTAVLAVGLVAIAWTVMGGIATVIWTDAMLFLALVGGAAALLFVIAGELDTGFERILQVGVDAHKFRLFDFDTSPATAYTLWVALLAAPWMGVGAFGTDQLMVQRVLCCRNVADARKAVVASQLGVGVTALVMLVGVGLFAYYERNPLTGEALALFEGNGERLLPIFVLSVVPEGLRGLVLAGVFAAAISSLDSILTALSQTLLSAFRKPLRRGAEGEEDPGPSVASTRVLVVVCGLALCAVAVGMRSVQEHYASILDLALAVAGYTWGALLAGFLLAFLRARVDGSGYVFAAPLSVLCVYAVAWSDTERLPGRTVPEVATLCGALLLLGAWLALRALPDLRAGAAPRGVARRTLLLAAGGALAVWLAHHGAVAHVLERPGGALTEYRHLAFPWFPPLGCTVAFVFGYLLARPAPEAAARAALRETAAPAAADSAAPPARS